MILGVLGSTSPVDLQDHFSFAASTASKVSNSSASKVTSDTSKAVRRLFATRGDLLQAWGRGGGHIPPKADGVTPKWMVFFGGNPKGKPYFRKPPDRHVEILVSNIGEKWVSNIKDRGWSVTIKHRCNTRLGISWISLLSMGYNWDTKPTV